MTDTQGGRDTARNSDLIFLVDSDGSLTRASSTAYSAEADLQKLLADYVDLLPGAQINPANPRRWLLIKREAGVPDHEGGGGWWSVDHLAVDQDAVPTFVEVKRASDTRSRREVVAQMLDYAANGSMFWTPELLRSWFEGDDAIGATERLMELLGPSDDEPEDAAETFWQKVGTNLREGQIRLVFVADEVPASLQRLVEFLNEQMPRVEVLALEIRQYRADGSASGALVPSSFTIAADTGRSRSRYRGVLTLYSSPYGGPPMLEIQVKLMRRTPPYNRSEEWAALMANLRALGIPRLSSEADFTGIRPNIPLDQLTSGRIQRLLPLVEQWIDKVRAHAGESEPADET